jgi:guanylate kinase
MPGALYLFLAPPTMAELARRRLARGTETPQEQDLRQQLAERELQFADRYNRVIVNDTVDNAVETILEEIGRYRGGVLRS